MWHTETRYPSLLLLHLLCPSMPLGACDTQKPIPTATASSQAKTCPLLTQRSTPPLLLFIANYTSTLPLYAGDAPSAAS